ncbi:MAG: hypothetical protein ACRELC_11620 [Gemmatimonadota bacterium]
MSVRKFRDREGRGWRVEVRSRREWRLAPLPGNPAAPRVAVPPLYAEDPFELSDQELWRILDGARERPAPPPSPFSDDAPPKGSPFSD